ncbi:hypothetical protein BCR39DRAFT_549823 [Naematelia encephala]|uniref:Nucleolar protein 9 n=1 Tax=Naematelia encephala TaxID=71784 RepID=A0A1Y2ALX1_9TREE|nr:hypothetical protein BCR39DRAFT_549823 [Naematelia encephala]
MGHYHTLAMDRMGSRVADTIWAASDGYMKEKIATSLITHALTLGGSQYGRFFARKLNLHLLERRPDEWRNTVAGKAAVSSGSGHGFERGFKGGINGDQKIFESQGKERSDTQGKESEKVRVGKESMEGEEVKDGKKGEEEGEGKGKGKRKYQEDEIDQLFAGFKDGKKKKRKV